MSQLDSMDLTQDYFSHFGLPLAFQVDLVFLADRYRQLQQVYHPDRFISGTDVEQRVAVQKASYLNQAYAILRCPLRRAVYLLELVGRHPLAPTNTSMPTDFMLQQIALRERMEVVAEAHDVAVELDSLANSLQAMHTCLQAEFASSYNEGELDEAEIIVRKLQFVDKLQQQCHDLEGRLLD
jgi:molecular chaperone HscB